MSAYDDESRKRQLTRDSMPAKQGSLRWLEERVSLLEGEVKRLRWQNQHGGDHICDECWPAEDADKGQSL
jgi:uncharacterized small protein (DUF1192 family)